MSELTREPREEIFITTDHGSIEGFIDPGEARVAMLEHVEVEEGARLQGEGTQLVRSFGNEAIRMGAGVLETVAVEPGLGRIMGKVFGEANLVITAADQPPDSTLLNFDTAMSMLEQMAGEASRVSDDEDVPDSQRTGIRIGVDLHSPEVARLLAGQQEGDDYFA